jgi:hypothetical protein
MEYPHPTAPPDDLTREDQIIIFPNGPSWNRPRSDMRGAITLFFVRVRAEMNLCILEQYRGIDKLHLALANQYRPHNANGDPQYSEQAQETPDENENLFL